MTKFIDVKKELTGFTLMEIIIVIVILGILAAIAAPNYTNAVNKQKGNVTISNIRLIIVAEKIYKMKNNNFWPPPFPAVYYLTVSDAEIKATLRIQIYERYFEWGTKDYYLINYGSWFEIRTCAKWVNPWLYICVKWNPSNNKINWTYKSLGVNYWFDKYPDTIPDDNDTTA